jgi:hypothetical protein
MDHQLPRETPIILAILHLALRTLIETHVAHLALIFILLSIASFPRNESLIHIIYYSSAPHEHIIIIPNFVVV